MTRDPLVELPDGTVKQYNPLTGTEVWTVPGRGHRPLSQPKDDVRELVERDHTGHCAFCQGRYLETPPEKSRLILDGDGWRRRDATPAAALEETIAQFRQVPNLFEILGYDYWRLNHGFLLPPAVRRRRDAYVASSEGREHVRRVVAARRRAEGLGSVDLGDEQLREQAGRFFASGHDVIIARRHFVDGATDTSQLASSGTLTPEEHGRFIGFSAEAARGAYELNPHARYVVVFQNWLRAAGASFDHLHKQVVAIDEPGGHQEAALARLVSNPQAFNEDIANVAIDTGLLIAGNEHCIAFAGFGHRYPTIEVYSTAPACEPWRHSDSQQRGVSDVLHAVHAALGPAVACNEEWHYRPPGVAVAMPWRIVVKLRVSTLAGFEGASRIYLNTIAPRTLRGRLVETLGQARAEGRLAPGIAIGEEAQVGRYPLRYLAAD